MPPRAYPARRSGSYAGNGQSKNDKPKQEAKILFQQFDHSFAGTHSLAIRYRVAGDESLSARHSRRLRGRDHDRAADSSSEDSVSGPGHGRCRFPHRDQVQPIRR